MMKFVPKGVCRRLRMPSLRQAVTLTAIILVFHNEFLCFVLSRLHWASIPASTDDDSAELRVLLVADPQLVGFRDEHPVFGMISRWDCDRFLHSGFREAFNYIRPEIVVFLGDLLDEGSLATDEDFATYLERFHSVFHMPSNIQKIFISGDNDVGGEGMELKEQWKVNRFLRNFYKTNQTVSDVTRVKFVDFFRLSYDFGEGFASSIQTLLVNMTKKSTAPIRVICNHMGIFVRHPSQYAQMIAITKPGLIITAHTHKAAVYHCTECKKLLNPKFLSKPDSELDMTWKGSILPITGNRVFDFQLTDGNGVLEFVVPTCSYRMGMPEMGYGVVILGSTGKLQYTVLWLPSRYPLLYSYIVFVVVAVFVLAFAQLVKYLNTGHLIKWTKPRSF